MRPRMKTWVPHSPARPAAKQSNWSPSRVRKLIRSTTLYRDQMWLPVKTRREGHRLHSLSPWMRKGSPRRLTRCTVCCKGQKAWSLSNNNRQNKTFRHQWWTWRVKEACGEQCAKARWWYGHSCNVFLLNVLVDYTIIVCSVWQFVFFQKSVYFFLFNKIKNAECMRTELNRPTTKVTSCNIECCHTDC